jgi:antagonist of KipI
MGLRVVNPGLFTTVQDLGRAGFREYGVSQGGAFDRGAASLANALLGNNLEWAVLELTLVGGTYEACEPLALALAGAHMETRVRARDGNERRIEVPAAFPLGAGDGLTIGGAARGARAYLSVSGGWQTPVTLGSRSCEAPVAAGVVLPCASGSTPYRRPGPELVERHDDGTIRVIPGPDFAMVDPSWLMPGRSYVVQSSSDRKGLRLEGPGWPVRSDPNRVSTPVAPGAIQVAGGQPLLLGVSCGTMGGYPHVAHVITVDLDRVAQARPGDALTFSTIDLAEARRLDREHIAQRDTRLAQIGTIAEDRPAGTASQSRD